MPSRDFAILMAVCLIWAANSVVAKIVLSLYGVPPLFYTAGRMAIVALLTLPWLWPPPRPAWRMVTVGLLMGAVNFGCCFIGLRTVSPSANAVVGQLGAPLATLLSILVLGEKVGWRRALGIALTFAGVFAVSWDGSGFAVTPGALWIAGSALAAAVGAVMMKSIEGVKPLQFQAWVGFSSVWPLALLSALTEHGQWAAVAAAPLVFVGGVAFSALAVSLAAHTAYYGLIQRYDGAFLQPLTLISTLETIALGVVITGDAFGPRMAIGSAVTLAGAFIIAVRRNHVAPLLIAIRNRAV